MPKEVVTPAIRDCTDLVISMVIKTNSLALAAKSCCQAEDYDAGFEIVLQLEPLLHDITSVISAVCKLRRLND
jgi:hypothetical protein